MRSTVNRQLIWFDADLVVELAVNTLSISVDQFEGVGAVSIHVAETIRQPSVTEQERHLMEQKRKILV